MPSVSHHQRLLDLGWQHERLGHLDVYLRTVGDFSLSVAKVTSAKGFGFMWKAYRGREQVMSGSHMSRIGAGLDGAAWAAANSKHTWVNP